MPKSDTQPDHNRLLPQGFNDSSEALNSGIFHSVVDHMPNGLIYCQMLYDQEGHACDFVFLYSNAAFTGLTGWHDVAGKRISEVLPDILQSNPELLNIYSRVAKGAPAEKFESFIGTLGKWFIVNVFSPNREHFVAVFNDISEQKTFESALERLIDAVRQCDEVIIITDNAMQIHYVNPAFERLFGYTQEEINGKALSILLPDDAELKPYNKIENRAFTGEKLRRAKDGRNIPVLLKVGPILDHEGTDIGFIGTMTDLTEIKSVMKTLAESEAFNRAILDSVSDEIAVLDRHGFIIKVNESWSKFSLENSLIPGKPYPYTDIGSNYLAACQSSINDDAGANNNPQEGIRAVLEGRLSTFSMEYPCHTADQQRWFKMKAMPVGSAKYGAVISHTDISEFKLAEQALQSSEMRFRNLLENIPSVAVQGYGSNGVIHYWNEASENIYGYTADEAIGKNLLELIIPQEMHDDVKHAIQSMFASGCPTPSSELSLLRKDGTKVDVFSSHAYVHVPGKEPELFCVDVDLSERKRIEEALRASEQRWQFALEGAGDGVWDVNLETCKSHYSKRYQEMLGYADGEFTDSHSEWLVRIHPDDRERVDEAVTSYLEDKSDIYAIEYRLRCKDGNYKWIFARGMTVSRNADGQPLRMVGTHTDVTERKKMEGLLRESEERFRKIANSAPLLIWIAGSDSLCSWFSQGWLDFTGNSLDHELGNGWTKSVHPDDLARCLDTYLNHFNQRQPFHMEYRIKHHSGEYRWIHDNGVPRFDDNGEFLGYIGSCLDITDAHEVQEAFKKSQEMLNEAQHIAHLGSWDWSIVDGKVNWSEEAANIYVPDIPTITPSFEAFQQSIHPDDRDKVMAAIAAALDYGLPYNIEHRVVSKIKGIRTVHAQGVVYREVNGLATRMVGSVHDVTDQLRAEQSIKETREQLESMTAAVPGVVYQFVRFISGEWQFLYLSKGVEELYGVTAENALLDYRVITHRILPEDRAAQRESVEHSARTFTLWAHDFRIITTDGRLKWVRGRATPKLQADGSILWNGILTDITELKKVEDSLLLSSSVFAHTQESIIITDANCHIIEVNAAFIREHGYSREEIIGKNPHILQSGIHSKEFYQSMWQGIEESGYWSGELWNRKKNGDIYAALLTISAVKNEQGLVSHYLGVSTNITHIKNHQKELEHIAHHDALTGLPNRILLADRMKQVIAHAKREKQLLAVCYLDLDGFKPINDAAGHEAGDQVLIEVGKRIGETIRSGDTVARLGGDEFVILLLGVDQIEEYMTTFDRLLNAISQPITIAGNDYRVSASIGVSLYPQNSEDPDTLLRQADQAMYSAKQSGKNRYQLYNRQ